MKNFKKIISSLLLLLTITVINPVQANASYWKQDSNNHWNYVQDNGYNAVGWRQVDGKWYYFNENEVMQTGWLQNGGNWYYCYGDGSLATNTTIDGCYLNGNGAWSTAPTVTTSNDNYGTSTVDTNNNKNQTAYLSATGDKYHSISNCGRMNPNKATKTTVAKAEQSGCGRCSKCW